MEHKGLSVVSAMFRQGTLARDTKGRTMLAVMLSVLFGLVAFAALAQVWVSVGAGMRRGLMLQAELAPTGHVLKARSARRPGRPSWQHRIAAA